MTEEFKPRFELGQKVYFTDRHALDVVDAEVIQWIGYDSEFGDRYSVFSAERGEFYSVWEDDLTRWQNQAARSPLCNLAFLLCECAVIALVVIAARWLM